MKTDQRDLYTVQSRNNGIVQLRYNTYIEILKQKCEIHSAEDGTHARTHGRVTRK